MASTQFDFMPDHDQSSEVLNDCRYRQLGTKSFEFPSDNKPCQ